MGPGDEEDFDDEDISEEALRGEHPFAPECGWVPEEDSRVEEWRWWEDPPIDIAEYDDVG